MNGANSRVGAIDVLRGGAVIGVILTHCAFVVPAIGDFWFRIFRSGQYGVDLFFVISGYVLTDSIHRRGNKVGWAEQWGFLRRRMRRLFPLYWLGIVAFGLLIEDRLVMREGETPLFAWVGNVLLLNGWQPGWENRVVPGGWSIGAEATFALLFALLYPKIAGLRSAVVTWLGALLITLWVAPSVSAFVAGMLGEKGDADSAYFSFYYLPTFAAGIVVWYLQQSGRARRISPRAGGALLLLALGVVLGRSFGIGTEWDRGLIVGTAMAIVVLVGIRLPVASQSAAAMGWVGRISYGSYLVHFAMIGIAETILIVVLPVGAPMLLMFGLLVGLVCGLTFPIAWLVENSRTLLRVFEARKSGQRN